MKLTPLTLFFSWAVFSSALPAQRVGGGMDKVGEWLGSGDEDHYGDSIALLDDYDGDGLADLGIGASQKYAPFNAGYAQIRSTATGAVLATHSGSNYERFGSAIENVGDLTGDGITDYAIGIPRRNDGEVILYSGATHTAFMTIPAPAGGGYFGEQIVNMGDVNGDGWTDFAVGGTRSNSGGLTYNGAVFLISGANGSVIYSRHGSEGAEYLGDTIANIGDIDGDRVDDLAAGADCIVPYNQNNTGKVYVWSGATGGLIYYWTGSREYGGCVSAAGDANGDGRADIAVGSPYEETGTYQEGIIRMYSGSTGSLLWDWNSGEVLEQVGHAMGAIGDFNQDGYDDLVAGAPMGNTSYLLSGVNGSILHRFEHEISMSRFGAEVECPGDFDGDGELDVFLAATNSYVNHEEVGGVYQFGWNPFVSANTSTVSASAGGTVNLSVDFPPGTNNGNYSLGNISHDYVLLASAAGTGPSNLYGWQVPLTADSLYYQTLNGNYPAPISNGSGALSLDGDATITIQFAAGTMTPFVGQTFYVAVTHYEYGSPWPTMVHGPSVSLPVTILP